MRVRPLVTAAALIVAALAGQQSVWWLVGLASVAGGVGYSLCSQQWWVAYLRDPVRQGAAPSMTTRLALGLTVGAGLLLMAFLR